jgi:hypothetical protein
LVDTALNIGTGRPIVRMARLGDRLLVGSADPYGAHWMLWELSTRSQVIFGENFKTNSSCAPSIGCGEEVGGAIAMESGTFIVQSDAGIDIRDPLDGHLRATVTTPPFLGVTSSQVGLAEDGSYVFANTTGGLFVWSALDGSQLFQIPGDYSKAGIYAAAGQLKVGDVVANTIKTIAVPGGATTTTAVSSGTFAAWFQEGDRFLTNLGNNVWVYAADGTQQQFLTLSSTSNLGGAGSYVWSSAGVVALSDPSTVVCSGPGIVSNLAIGAYPICHLEVSPAYEETPTPLGGTPLSAFASDGEGHWAAGTGDGRIYDGDQIYDPAGPRSLDCGTVTALTGSPSGRSVVSTADGLLVFDLAGNAPVLLGMAKVGPARSLQLSDTGNLLAMNTSNTVQTLDMPAVSPRHLFATPFSSSFSLSADGSRIATQSGITDVDGVVTYYPGPYAYDAVLSSSNSWFAIKDHTNCGANGTQIFTAQGVVHTAVPGCALGWLDDQRLLMANGSLYDSSGNLLAFLSIPRLGPFEVVSSNAILIDFDGAIYDVTTGAALYSPVPAGWVGPTARVGNQVLWLDGTILQFAPY